MARRVEEWIGKNDDDWPPPKSVQTRITRAANNLCGRCRLRVRVGNGDIDHKIPLWTIPGSNSGNNRESNLQYVHKHCHKGKTSEEAAERARSNRKFQKIHGITKSKGRSSNWRKKPKPKPGYWEPYDFDEETGRYRRTRWVDPSFEIPEGE
jgi:5-methylcytosine-specific restriction protein A